MTTTAELKKGIKPPDPEPLECWGVFNSEGKLIQFSQQELCVCPGGCKIVHMRQVTPQDEQDRMDAARYRKAKEWLTRSDMLIDAKPGKWDELIDEAMEGGDAK